MEEKCVMIIDSIIYDAIILIEQCRIGNVE